MGEPVDVPGLRRTAFLLCGDWPAADELVHRALTAVAAGRRRADHTTARAALVRCWRAAAPAREPGPGEPELVRALGRMSPRRRGCVVLRYWERCPVAETARLLGCSAAEVHRETTAGLEILVRWRSGCDLKPE